METKRTYEGHLYSISKTIFNLHILVTLRANNYFQLCALS